MKARKAGWHSPSPTSTSPSFLPSSLEWRKRRRKKAYNLPLPCRQRVESVAFDLIKEHHK